MNVKERKTRRTGKGGARAAQGEEKLNRLLFREESSSINSRDKIILNTEEKGGRK